MKLMTAHKVNRENIDYVVQRLRPLDKDELLDQQIGDDLTAVTDQALDTLGLKFVLGIERPIMCIGASLLHPGVYQGWMFATEEFPRIALPATRFARRHLIPHLLREGHRCQSIVAAKNTPATRWLEVLGGEKEAILRGYGRSGGDFVMYRVLNHV